MHFSTLAVHAGQEPDPATGAVMTPVYLTSTFAQDAPGVHRGYDYARTANPTRSVLEATLAALEGGAHALAFASGMAAAATVLHTLAAGDHVLCGQDVYGGSYRILTQVFQRLGIDASFVDATDAAAVESGFTPATRLLWLETPSNPLLTVCDVARLARLAHARGARVLVDNTFASPCLQRPLALGADLVLHSTTKYLGGHSDVIGGALVCNDPALYESLHFLQNAVGAVPGPLDCFLVLRGVKTLALRMRQHCNSAHALAQRLEAHPEVLRVHYPGLPSHPGHALAARQMAGFGGMISLELAGGAPRAARFATATRLFTLAESLGGVESLLSLPAAMTHASIPAAQRQRAGLPDALVRLSVGIEDTADLIADVEQALAASRSP